MVPQFHAESSAKRYGGKPEDYLEIHVLMDSTKACFSNNAHRVLSHNSWFTGTILPLLYKETGGMIINSDGKKIPAKDIGEYHVLEDFRNQFIPTPQDYLENLVMQPWMNNGMGVPPRVSKQSFNRELQKEYIEKTGSHILNSPEFEEFIKDKELENKIDSSDLSENNNQLTNEELLKRIEELEKIIKDKEIKESLNKEKWLPNFPSEGFLITD